MYDLEGDYAKAQFDTYKNYALSTLDASISETNSLAASDAYFARIAADNYGTITVDDDAYAMRQQFDNDNFQAQNAERKEINAAKADAVKTVKKETRNAVNNDFTGYFESLIGIQTTYENAVAPQMKPIMVRLLQQMRRLIWRSIQRQKHLQKTIADWQDNIMTQ